MSPLLNTTYDFCIIDNPPAINVVVANSLAASNNHHLLVCRAFALNGLMELSATLDDVQQFMNPSLIVDGILITINAAIDYGHFIDEFLGGNFHG